MSPAEKAEKLNQIAFLVRRGGGNCMVWQLEEPSLAALGPTDPALAIRQIRVNNDGLFELWQIAPNGQAVRTASPITAEEGERIISADYVLWKQRQAMPGRPA